MRNGDIDIYYQTLPTAADKVALLAMPNVTTLTRVGGNYSHMHIRVDAKQGNTDTYSGIFAGNGVKAKDLRKALLLATPRQQAVDVLIKPVKDDAAPLDTQFAFAGTPEYNTLPKGSGVAIYSAGTQAERTAQALAIVKKYYPTASEATPVPKLKFLHYNNSVRNNIAKLFAAEWKKAGFDVEDVARTDSFFDDISLAEFDVTMYGFGLNSISQSNGTEIFKSDGGNNGWGWNDSALDALMKSLQGEILTPAEVTAKRLAADKIIMSNYWGLALYANPTITAFNKALKNVKPAPVGNNTTWNYFEWSY